MMDAPAKALRVAVTTFGCKANLSDSASLVDALAAELGVPVSLGHNADGADVAIINTCTVTLGADADARQAIRRVRRASPTAMIVVTGCYAQTDGDALRAMPEVTAVIGNVDKSALPAIVARLVRGEPATPASRVGHRDWNPTLREAAAIRALPAGIDRPFVKVQDGCDYTCSFCIIPVARGASRSRSLAEVAEEVRRYESLGAQEVVLTGIHLGHWGRDLDGRPRFGVMLERLLAETSHVRFRISSLEPNEVDDHVLDLAVAHPRVCPHLHVPLQSGDDGTLTRMNRVYRARHYARAIDRFRALTTHGAWGADVMVGFPGEDDDAFEATRRFISDHGFSYLHVFPYSPRRGTVAASLPGAVLPRLSRERATRLGQLSETLRDAHARQSIGRVGRVLVETGLAAHGQRVGYTEAYVPVTFGAEHAQAGALVSVHIESVVNGRAAGFVAAGVSQSDTPVTSLFSE